MSKFTELADAVAGVITNVRNLADSLQELGNILTELKSVGTMETKVAGLLPETEEKPKKNKAKEKTYTLEDVRGVLAEKSQNGLTAEVKELITKFGGTKLSDVDPKNYSDLIKEAEGLGNE